MATSKLPIHNIQFLANPHPHLKFWGQDRCKFHYSGFGFPIVHSYKANSQVRSFGEAVGHILLCVGPRWQEYFLPKRNPCLTNRNEMLSWTVLHSLRGIKHGSGSNVRPGPETASFSQLGHVLKMGTIFRGCVCLMFLQTSLT